MKKLTLLTIIAICSYTAISQTFLNGDFENNYVETCAYNLTNIQFNDTIQDVYSYGINSQIDIQTNGCYVNPQHGNWCIGLAADEMNGYDAITLELSSPLNIGDSYELIFWTYGNTEFHALTDSIKIGLSPSSDSFGNKIYADLPSENTWEEHIVHFIADSDFSFISVEIKTDFSSLSWYQVDNFTINNTTGIIQTSLITEISLYPNPSKDMIYIDLGRNYSKINTDIISLDGKIVLNRNFINSQFLEIDISELKQGAYFVRINNSAISANLKLIKE